MNSRTFEEKQWLVTRIEALLDVIENDIETRKQGLIKIKENIDGGFSKSRTIILTIMGITISTIFGFVVLGLLDSTSSGWTILIIIILGILSFAILNYTQRKISQGIAPLQMCFWKANDHHKRVRIRVIDETTDLNKFSFEKLEAFYNYVYLTLGVSLVMMLNAAKEGKEKSYAFKLFRPMFTQVINDTTNALKAFEKLFYDYEVQLKDNGFLDGLYLEILKPAVDYFKQQNSPDKKS